MRGYLCRVVIFALHSFNCEVFLFPFQFAISFCKAGHGTQDVYRLW